MITDSQHYVGLNKTRLIDRLSSLLFMQWSILNPDPQLVKAIQQTFNTSEVIARVLANRRITDKTAANVFFQPKWDTLHDPFLMQDMSRSVERVLQNIRCGKPILIFGDYDVDGTTGTAALFLALKTFGARVSYFIPDREQDGYGLCRRGVDYAVKCGADLIITCDCGINAFAPITYARQRQIDIIITDHHTPDESLPDAFAILNPKRADCTYPFKDLCGGGVAFKLITALGQELNIGLGHYADVLPLVTLGTAADIVPIKGENRIIVSHGLNLLHDLEKPGLRTLLDLAGLQGELSVGQLVFWIAPRINAAGRLGDANRAVELFITTDSRRARLLAKELDEENKKRQVIQQAVVDQALLKINAEADLKHEHALVIAAEGWHPGVVGIVASKMKEEFYRPTVIISMEHGVGKGSARSISGFDLYSALTACKDHLVGYGGHPMAAGLTVTKQNLPAFKTAFINQANVALSKTNLVHTLTIDSAVDLRDITPRFMEFLDKLGPYGPGNMRPRFAVFDAQVRGAPKVIGQTGEHLRFTVCQGGRTYPAIGFGLVDAYELLIKGQPLDLAFVVETNEWRGQESIQLNIRDIKPTALS